MESKKGEKRGKEANAAPPPHILSAGEMSTARSLTKYRKCHRRRSADVKKLIKE